jgi:acetyltransferase-like isoleucine patch superfamily enzyme
MSDQRFNKDDILKNISARDRSGLEKYQDFFVGSPGIGTLLRYELATLLAGPMPGAIGYILRKLLMLPLLRRAGDGIQIGQQVTIRHPGKISIGDRSAIDDNCMLDARGIKPGEFTIGSDVIIARGSILASKSDQGFIEIGDHCTIGKGCIIGSTGGIRIGQWVGLADTSYVGGGRYRTDRRDIPMMKQDTYSKGPIVIGDDCWIGTGVLIMDGVTIGRGSIIGAGAVVREDVPEYTVVTPHQRLLMLPRATETMEK